MFIDLWSLEKIFSCDKAKLVSLEKLAILKLCELYCQNKLLVNRYKFNQEMFSLLSLNWVNFKSLKK